MVKYLILELIISSRYQCEPNVYYEFIQGGDFKVEYLTGKTWPEQIKSNVKLNLILPKFASLNTKEVNNGQMLLIFFQD